MVVILNCQLGRSMEFGFLNSVKFLQTWLWEKSQFSFLVKENRKKQEFRRSSYRNLSNLSGHYVSQERGLLQYIQLKRWRRVKYSGASTYELTPFQKMVVTQNGRKSKHHFSQECIETRLIRSSQGKKITKNKTKPHCKTHRKHD